MGPIWLKTAKTGFSAPFCGPLVDSGLELIPIYQIVPKASGLEILRVFGHSPWEGGN